MIKGALAFLAVWLFALGSAQATYMERPAEDIRAFEIEGIRLAMPAEDALAAAEEAGFELFQKVGVDQDNPVGWEYLRKDTMLELLHQDGVITQISLMIFPGPEPIDGSAEIERMARHFEAAEDEKWCWLKATGGVCSVKDPAGRHFIVMKTAPFGFEVRANLVGAP
ncbi:MAG: hypothetical protein AAF495_05120 [Pseudomonadota bacterium]